MTLWIFVIRDVEMSTYYDKRKWKSTTATFILKCQRARRGHNQTCKKTAMNPLEHREKDTAEEQWTLIPYTNWLCDKRQTNLSMDNFGEFVRTVCWKHDECPHNVVNHMINCMFLQSDTIIRPNITTLTTTFDPNPRKWTCAPFPELFHMSVNVDEKMICVIPSFSCEILILPISMQNKDRLSENDSSSCINPTFIST